MKEEGGFLVSEEVAAFGQWSNGARETEDPSSTEYDIQRSYVLPSALAVLMLGGPLLYLLSNYFHNLERQRLLLQIIDFNTFSFLRVEGVWTFSIMHEEGDQGPGSGVSAEAKVERARRERDASRVKQRAQNRMSQMGVRNFYSHSVSFDMKFSDSEEEEEEEQDAQARGRVRDWLGPLEKDRGDTIQVPVILPEAEDDKFKVTGLMSAESHRQSSAGAEQQHPVKGIAIPTEGALTDAKLPGSFTKKEVVVVSKSVMTTKITPPSDYDGSHGSQPATEALGPINPTAAAAQSATDVYQSQELPALVCFEREDSADILTGCFGDASHIAAGPVVEAYSERYQSYDGALQLTVASKADELGVLHREQDPNFQRQWKAPFRKEDLRGRGLPLRATYTFRSDLEPCWTLNTPPRCALRPLTTLPGHSALRNTASSNRAECDAADQFPAAPLSWVSGCWHARAQLQHARTQPNRMLRQRKGYVERTVRAGGQRRDCSATVPPLHVPPSALLLRDKHEELLSDATSVVRPMITPTLLPEPLKAAQPTRQQQATALEVALAESRRGRKDPACWSLRSSKGLQALDEGLDLDITRLQIALPLQYLRSVSNRQVPSPVDQKGFADGVGGHDLNLNRFLGTALVHAFFGVHKIMGRAHMLSQLEMASKVEWRIVTERPFIWYLRVFKVMIGNLKTEGWYQRAALWNLVFLQRPDGSFTISGALAFVFKAGPPDPACKDNPERAYNPKLIEEAVPEVLRLALERGAAPPHKLGELWATLLVVAFCARLPERWIVNPEDELRNQVTLDMQAEDCVIAECNRYPHVRACITEVREQASELIVEWWAQHYDYMEREVQQVAAAKDFSPRKARGHAVYLKLRRVLRFLVRSHVLGSIYTVKATDPFSRSERILVQGTSFLLMLMVSVWLHYSRATTCCRDMRVFLGCPNTTDIRSPCLGYGYCYLLENALKVPADEVALPSELASWRFECNAFPQSTYAAQLYAVLIMAAILVPVFLVLATLFRIGAKAGVPSHWRSLHKHWNPQQMGRGKSQTASSQHRALRTLQQVFFVVYAVFFSARKLKKALASTLVRALSAVSTSAPMRRALKAISTLHSASKALRGSIGFNGRSSSLGGRNEAEDTARMVGVLDGALIKLAYICIVMIWGAVAMSLFTYSVLLQELFGADTERKIVQTWALGLMLDLFGLEMIKITGMRAAARFVARNVDLLLSGTTDYTLAYEGHLSENLKRKMRRSGSDQSDAINEELGDI
ncbi:hypothetical protein CYMTET_5123 [Cymbomonas tetramitiformis]|uniref:Uncharacterized protein n=1 Tax=Cymbomonas tetramitiformis TaxID=36881 RepID=A0AAE0GZT4_9CHLO|nr:hypothetical protein CYMTET_5123 [Cymbomonas tetramitiformis]